MAAKISKEELIEIVGNAMWPHDPWKDFNGNIEVATEVARRIARALDAAPTLRQHNGTCAKSQCCQRPDDCKWGGMGGCGRENEPCSCSPVVDEVSRLRAAIANHEEAHRVGLANERALRARIAELERPPAPPAEVEAALEAARALVASHDADVLDHRHSASECAAYAAAGFVDCRAATTLRSLSATVSALVEAKAERFAKICESVAAEERERTRGAYPETHAHRSITMAYIAGAQNCATAIRQAPRP